MAIPESWAHELGSWTGKYKLNRSWLAPDKQVTESKSSLHLDSDKRRTYASISYDWEVDGERQEGTMLLCYAPKAKRLEIGWADSWHLRSSIMKIVGEESADGSFHCKGTYDASGQTWGWTIDISITRERLTVKMDNVTPDGKAEWAVDSVYQRA